MIKQDVRAFIQQTRSWSDLFTGLQGLDAQISLVVTGGGTGAIEKCLRRAGASKHFVEALVPYSRHAVTELLGRPLESPSVSGEAAVALAREALERAKRLGDQQSSLAVGIALTAALPTTPLRDHQDAIYVAMKTEKELWQWCVELPKGEFDREAAEEVADAMVYQALETLV